MHTRDDRKKPGIKRPFLKIPDTLEGEQCFCITIPGGLQNKLILLDVLQQTTWWFSYQRTAGTEGKQTADRWRDLLDLPRLTMCCCPDPTNQYYDENGILQVSYDGGATYTPATDDPRFNSPLSPELPGVPGDVKRCTAANNVTGYVKSTAEQLIADGTAWNNITTLLAAIGAIILVLLSIGTAGALTPLILGLVSALVGTGLAAFTAAMTEEVWSELACIVYCNTPDDAVYTEANWQAIKAQVASGYDGIVEKFIYDTVNAMGLAGLNNASRAGVHAGQPCECACGECQYLVTFNGANLTTFTVLYGSVSSERLNFVAHTYPLGEGTGASIRIDFPVACNFRHVACDTNYTNQRPDGAMDVLFQFFDASDTELDPTSIHLTSSGAGTTHSEQSALVDGVAYAIVSPGWINVGAPNSGWIDSIGFSSTPL